MSKAIPLEASLSNAILNSLPCSIVLADEQGKTEWVNRGFSEMCGYTLEEALGKKPGELLHGPATDLRTVQRISETLQRREACSERILNYDKRGRSYWASIDIAPFDDGERKGFVAVVRDLTAGFNAKPPVREDGIAPIGHLSEAVGHLAQAANEEHELHQFCLSLADALASVRR